MSAYHLCIGADADTPPIRLRDDRKQVEFGRINLPWLTALVLIGCAAGGLMTAPLLSLSSRQVRLASTQYGAGNAPAASAIVGIRGDRLEAEVASTPNILERRLEHRRLGRGDLRSYTFVLARPSLARTVAYQDSTSGDAPAADQERQGVQGGLVGLHSSGPIGTPLNVTTVDKSLSVQPEREIVVVLDGDTLEAVLRAAHLTNEDAANAAVLLGNQMPDRRVQDGDLVQFEGSRHDGTEKPCRIAVFRNSTRLAIVALNDQARYGSVDPAGRAADPPQTAARLDDFSGGNVDNGQSLRQGLYALADGGQMDHALLDDIIRVCAHDVDLGAPASSKDTIAVLYSPVTSDGRTQPELAYLSITAGGREHTFYRFAPDEDDEARYFDATGHSASETLMRKPIAAGRLGDGFGWRIHPVLKDRRFHEGVDYAAPYGSPIVAAGAGVVEKIDAQWGYGKYVRVKHDRGYETTYAHISSVPAGLQVGSRVRQGQTIAFVGSTGLSTGPHLYYEVRINGRDVDPLRVKLESSHVLQGDELTSFDLRKARIDTLVKEASAGGGLQVADTVH